MVPIHSLVLLSSMATALVTERSRSRTPPETWEDENLNRIDQGLKKTFDLQDRYRDIREGLEIVRENLELFKDLLQYRNSTFLEWIIIILVALEVVNLLIDKLFKV